MNASAAAFTHSYGEFQRVASQQEPAYRVRGILDRWLRKYYTELRALFPGARLVTCLRHALLKLPKNLVPIASPMRKALRFAVSYFVIPGVTAEEFAGVCARPVVTPLCRPCRPHCGGGQWPPG